MAYKDTSAYLFCKFISKKYKPICTGEKNCRILRYKNKHMENPVTTLKARCAAAGTNLTALCKRAGVARQTIEYWKKNPNPQAITIAKLDAALEAIINERK